MIITHEAKKLISEQLSNDPLKGGEIRRVEGMGGLYMTLLHLDSDDEFVQKGDMKYWYLYSIKVGDVDCCFYGGAHTGLSEEKDQ